MPAILHTTLKSQATGPAMLAMRAHGLTYVHNDPRGGIEMLFRAIAGAP